MLSFTVFWCIRLEISAFSSLTVRQIWLFVRVLLLSMTSFWILFHGYHVCRHYMYLSLWIFPNEKAFHICNSFCVSWFLSLWCCQTFSWRSLLALYSTTSDHNRGYSIFLANILLKSPYSRFMNPTFVDTSLSFSMNYTVMYFISSSDFPLRIKSIRISDLLVELLSGKGQYFGRGQTTIKVALR